MLKNSSKSPYGTQQDLFRSQLKNIINLKHKLCILGGLVDWSSLEQEFSELYCKDKGAPGKPIRLMCGLLLLKEIEGLSDEDICAKWIENPYFQYFCGEEYFQHEFPTDPSNLVYFRNRIGESGFTKLLEETVKIGLKSETIKDCELKQVIVDSTVQEKNVRYPTDTHLYFKAREELVSICKKYNIKLRQNYCRLSKKARFMSGRYGASRKLKKARGETKRLRNYLGRVLRDIERQTNNFPHLAGLFTDKLEKAKKIYNQKRTDKNKIYSWHAPEVECIAKGKVHKKYEFGCKASFTTTHKSNFIVGAFAIHGNPHDSKTLSTALEQAENLTGTKIKRAFVDQGYRGHNIKDKEIFISRQKKKMSKYFKKALKRRSAIEPVISHVKHDGKRGARNFLQGTKGDKINAIAIAIGFNLRKILNYIFLPTLKYCSGKYFKIKIFYIRYFTKQNFYLPLFQG